jgi:hypothetical protein
VTPAAISLLLVHLKKRRLGAFAQRPSDAQPDTTAGQPTAPEDTPSMTLSNAA